MALPKLTIPTYTLTVPSTKLKTKYRPFLSKEEKVLMLVKQSENSTEILDAVKQIVDVCTFEKLSPSVLALFDLEYIFLQIRSKSVGEVIEIDMKCNNNVESVPLTGENEGKTVEKKCGSLIPFVINIPDIKVITPKGHSKIIKLEKDIGVTMRYPSIDDLEMLEKYKEDDVEIIKHLIENIFDRDNVYNVADTPEEELQEFVDNISSKQIDQIKNEFFYTMPSLSHTIKYKCPKCGYEGEYTFSGINDFF